MRTYRKLWKDGLVGMCAFIILHFFYFTSGESLKKSHLMDSSSDIMNMEEGGAVFTGRTTVDYTKVKFHCLSKWVWDFWPTSYLTNVEANSCDSKEEKLVYFIDFQNITTTSSQTWKKKNMKLTSFKMHSSLVWEWFSNFHNCIYFPSNSFPAIRHNV